MSSQIIGAAYCAILAAIPAVLCVGTPNPLLFWVLITLFFFMAYGLGRMLASASKDRSNAAVYAMAESERIRSQRFQPPTPPQGPSAVPLPPYSTPTPHGRHSNQTPEPDPAEQDPGLTLR